MTTYRLLIGGKAVAQFESAVAEYRSGGDATGHPMKIPGSYKTTDVTLKRGVILDASFSGWLSGLKHKHDAVLQTVDGAGRPLATYPLGRCWVTKSTGLDELVLAADNVAPGLSRRS